MTDEEKRFELPAELIITPEVARQLSTQFENQYMEHTARVRAQHSQYIHDRVRARMQTQGKVHEYEQQGYVWEYPAGTYSMKPPPESMMRSRAQREVDYQQILAYMHDADVAGIDMYTDKADDAVVYRYPNHAGAILREIRNGVETITETVTGRILSMRVLNVGNALHAYAEADYHKFVQEMLGQMPAKQKEMDMHSELFNDADRVVAENLEKARLEKEVAEKTKLVHKLTPFDANGQQPDGSVIRFGKSFGKSTVYLYAGIKANGFWYLSGPTQVNRAFSWQELVLWLISGTPIDPSSLIVFGEDEGNSVMDYVAPKAVEAAPVTLGEFVEDDDEVLRSH